MQDTRYKIQDTRYKIQDFVPDRVLAISLYFLGQFAHIGC